MSQELSFSIWSLAPWIPSVLDHMVEFSAQTIMFLVKAEPEITGLRDIIQKVNYTECYKNGTLYKGFHQESHFLVIQYLICFRCWACRFRPWCSKKGSWIMRLPSRISNDSLLGRRNWLRNGYTPYFQNPRRIPRQNYEYLFSCTFPKGLWYCSRAL